MHVESGIESFVGRMREQKISCRSRRLKYLPVHRPWHNLNTRSISILDVWRMGRCYNGIVGEGNQSTIVKVFGGCPNLGYFMSNLS
jgi:hypothetical protein